MSIELAIVILLFVFMFFALLVLLSNSKHPYITTLICSGSGIAGLIVVNLLAQFTGVSIGVNFFTAGISVLLGLPGVITMLSLRFIL